MLHESKKLDDYFSKNLSFLRGRDKLSMAEMGQIIGMSKSIIGNYEKGTAEPSASTVLKIVQHFGLTLQDLMKTDLSKVKEYAHPNAHPNAHLIVNDGREKYIKKVGITEKVIDTSGHQLVPITDIQAAAGTGFINAEHWDETDVLRLPPKMIKGANHLCIRIKGISMAPTLQDGGYVIVRLLDKSEWLNMPTDRIYVVVDKEGQTYLKRIKNRFSGQKGGFIVLSSDNPDKMSHPNFNLHPNEIGFIWYVEWYFTAKMPNIHDQYYTRLSRLEDTVDEMNNQFRAFKKQSELKK